MADAQPDTQPERSAGRPRDPAVTDRAVASALAIYNAKGLKGLNFDSVARASGVGKAALYARWTTAEHLLVDALESSVGLPEEVDTGSLLQDLLDYANKLWVHYAGPQGMISLRMNLDAAEMPDLSGPYHSFISGYRNSLARIVQRSIDRGEISDDEDSWIILDLIVGAVLLNALLNADGNDDTHDPSDRIATIVHASIRGVHAPENKGDMPIPSTSENNGEDQLEQ